MTDFSDFRQNPWDSTYSDRVMDPEIHTVGEFNFLPGIYGIALQDRPVPTTVTIVTNDTAADPYTEVTTNPLSGQFRVDYVRGLIQFNSADNGDSVEVNYSGRGSNVSIALIEDLIGSIASTFSTITATDSTGLVVEASNGTDAARFGSGNTSLTELLGDAIFNNKLRASSTSGLLFENNSGGDILTLGASGGIGAVFEGGVNAKGIVSAGGGSETAPDFYKDGDTNTGIWFNAADNISLVTGGSTRFRVLSTGQLQGVYESSVGTDYNTTLHNIYGARTWWNFNGEGTIAFRAGGNVSSLTDNGTGQYTITFTTALPDTDYNTVFGGKPNSGAANDLGVCEDRDTARTTSALRIICRDLASNNTDPNVVSGAIFR